MDIFNSIKDYFINWWNEAPSDMVIVCVGFGLILLVSLNKKIRNYFF